MISRFIVSSEREVKVNYMRHEALLESESLKRARMGVTFRETIIGVRETASRALMKRGSDRMRTWP